LNDAKKVTTCKNYQQVFETLKSKQSYYSDTQKVSEFTIRYLTDLTTALYLKGDITEDDIQVINNNGAYFATFAINESTVSTLLEATDGKYSPLTVLQAMKPVGENLQEENLENNPEYQTIIADYKTFFKNEKIADKYQSKISSSLSVDLQKDMYNIFKLTSTSFSSEGWKEKQKFVMDLLKLFQ